jgi:sugar lactone lactonase YvrE
MRLSAAGAFEGNLGTAIGPPSDRPGRFNAPAGVAVDGSGTAYVADTNNSRLQVFAPDGSLLKVIGGPGSAPGQFARPNAVAIDRAGVVYVADTGNNRIQKLAPDGGSLGSWGGFAGPEGITVDPAGDVWVADTGHDRVVRLSTGGRVLTILRRSSAGTLLRPSGVAAGRGGLLFVGDPARNRVQVLTRSGRFVTSIGSSGALPGQFREPAQLAAAPNGELFVADPSHNRVQRFLDASRASVGLSGSTRQRRTVVRSRGLLEHLRLSGAGRYRITVRGAGRTIARRSGSSAGPGDRRLRLRLTSAGKRLLRSRKRPRFSVRAVLVDAAGRTATHRHTVIAR